MTQGRARQTQGRENGHDHIVRHRPRGAAARRRRVLLQTQGVSRKGGSLAGIIRPVFRQNLVTADRSVPLVDAANRVPGSARSSNRNRRGIRRTHPCDAIRQACGADVRPGVLVPDECRVKQRAIRRLAVRSDGAARRLRAAPRHDRSRPARWRAARACPCRARGAFASAGNTRRTIEASVGDAAR